MVEVAGGVAVVFLALQLVAGLAEEQHGGFSPRVLAANVAWLALGGGLLALTYVLFVRFSPSP